MATKGGREEGDGEDKCGASYQTKISEAPDNQVLPISFRDPLGVRTQDPILKRDVLYLLS